MRRSGSQGGNARRGLEVASPRTGPLAQLRQPLRVLPDVPPDAYDWLCRDLENRGLIHPPASSPLALLTSERQSSETGSCVSSASSSRVVLVPSALRVNPRPKAGIKAQRLGGGRIRGVTPCLGEL